jgi:CrcB protein
MMNVLLVFLGGGTGSVIRFFFAWLFSKTSLSLPFATLSSNLVSCLLFALLLSGYESRQHIPDNYKSFILIGICGGLSTFSTFSFESFELMRLGMTGWAIANILISCVLCIGIFFVFAK